MITTTVVACDHCGQPAAHRDRRTHDHLCEPCAAWRHGSYAGEHYAAAVHLAAAVAHAERELGRGTVRELLELVIEEGAEAIADVPNVGVLHADATRRPWRIGMENVSQVGADK